MIEQLFGSKTRVKLLQLFYSNPNRSFYVREITRKIDEQINSVRRELANLLNIGIITSDTNNNRLYYEVNQNFDYYKPLSMVFSDTGTAVAPKKAASASKAADDTPENAALDLRKLGNVELLVYTGQFTRDESSGIDILLVGDINQAKLNRFIEALEQEEAKELRYTVMGGEEFRYRRQINDRFLSNVLSAKKQVVVDKNQIVNAD